MTDAVAVQVECFVVCPTRLAENGEDFEKTIANDDADFFFGIWDTFNTFGLVGEHVCVSNSLSAFCAQLR